MNIRMLAITATAVLGTASLAFGSDLKTIADHAESIHKESTAISAGLKAKKMDAREVSNRLEVAGQNIANLKNAVDAYEAANPSMAGSAEWKEVKERVALLEIFHKQKTELVNSDFEKNRRMLRAHSEGVAKRAEGLLQTANRLQKGSSSSSGS